MADLPKEFPVVDLSTVFEPSVLRKTYFNLGEVLGEKEEPGNWDNIYSALRPFTQVNLQGEPLAGLVDEHNNPASLKKIYETLDAVGVAVSTIGPFAWGIEKVLIEAHKVKTPTQYLKERREDELATLAHFGAYLKVTKDLAGLHSSMPEIAAILPYD